MILSGESYVPPARFSALLEAELRALYRRKLIPALRDKLGDGR